MRAFVAIVDAGGFQAAADELGLTQQAVSKRIAALERSVGARLLDRSARGTGANAAGAAFLPHARELLRAEGRAYASVRGGRRALRVDVLNRRTAPATALHAFHRLHAENGLDVVTLPDADLASAVAAVLEGVVDATFRVLSSLDEPLPEPLRAMRAIDDRHELLIGPQHPLADARQVRTAELRAHRIWMPGMRADTEWGSYYAELGRTFGIRIDTSGPSFGTDALLDELASSPDMATFVGEGSRYLWPESYDLRRVPVVEPTPVYPHSIIWRGDDDHPLLAAFLEHLRQRRAAGSSSDTWAPSWVRAGAE